MEAAKRKGEDYVFSAGAYNETAYALMNGGFSVEAVGFLDLALEAFPENVNLYDSRAEALMRAGELDKARLAYKDALARAEKQGNEDAVQHARKMLEQLKKMAQ